MGKRTTSSGLALARAGRKDEASTELKKGRELIAANDRTQSANLDLAEARAALARGDLTEAEAKVRRAIESGPPSADAQALLDSVLAKSGHTEMRHSTSTNVPSAKEDFRTSKRR